MKATVILQKCPHSKKLFGIRTEELEDGEWYRTWAFPIDERRASREGYQNTHIQSLLPALEGYPGCPYCGSQRLFYDRNCGKISCYAGEERFTCPWCGGTYDVGSLTEKLNLQGGDL